MCRCLMAIDVVSQHGPNAQGVRSRPDRSVSLPVPDARGVAAEMMGGVGNLALKRLQKQHDDLISRYERLAPDSPNAPYNQERDELLQAIDEIEEQIRKMDPPPPPPPVEVLDLDDPAARKAALAKWGQRHVEPVPDLPPDTSAMSGEPSRIGRAHPERPPAPYEPGPKISDEDRERGKEAIEKIRKDHNLMEGLNPESKMDAAFLPEMFSQGTAQGSDGYFGGAGDLMGSIVEAVPGIDPKMAGMVAAAILAAVAAGTGFGGPLVPPILAGGAALASQ